jgi:microcystin-dependent protein
MNPFIGEVMIFASNFAPRGWAFCEGQLLAISQNTALFSILGTTYGGDGRTTFGLPDLRGRAAIGPGRGPGLENYRLGQLGGVETVTLTISQMPSHNHQVNAVSTTGSTAAPINAYLANTAGLDREYSTTTPDVQMNSNMLSHMGGNQAIENRQPFLAIYYIIALQGAYPSRS